MRLFSFDIANREIFRFPQLGLVKFPTVAFTVELFPKKVVLSILKLEFPMSVVEDDSVELLAVLELPALDIDPPVKNEKLYQ